ncbi:MAG TPA: hypothetical protein VK646_00670 [Actinomycetota bacterium]|nr:hypothetical protein [Actinomycetota bacterium]
MVATVEQRTIAGSHRRRGRVLLAVAAIVLAAAFVGAEIFLTTTYQPLNAPAGGHTDTTYRQGAPFSYAFTVWNTGRVPVTITGVDQGPTRFFSLYRVDQMLVSPPNSFGSITGPAPDFTPFQGFTLQPGEARSILIRATFHGCRHYAHDTAITVEQQRLTFRTFGASRTVWFPIPHFTIRSPNVCPGRA